MESQQLDRRESSVARNSAESLYDRSIRRVEPGERELLATACPICGHAGADALYEIEGLASRVVVCRGCAIGFLHPTLTPAQIVDQYPSSYYGSQGRKFTRLVEYGVRLVGRRLVAALARRTPVGGRVLDVGCGRGILLKDLADRGYEVHGFEVSPSAVEGIDPRVHVRIADDLKSAGYPSEYFDRIIIWHVLEHVSDPRTCICEMHRILKPGGQLIVAVPNFSSPQARWTGAAWFHLDLPRHLFHFPIESLKQLLASMGFAVVSEHHFSLRQNPFGWVQSVMNMLPGLPRNGLYEMLHARGRAGGSRFSTPMKAIFWSFFFIGMPIALAIEIVTAILRRGATVHVIAKRVL